MPKHKAVRLILIAGPILAVMSFVVGTHFFVSAQGPRIAYGDTVEGSLTSGGAIDTWTFDGLRGDVVQVQIARTDGDLLPSVALITPEGTLAVGLDWPDSQTTTTSFLTTLQVSGPYSLTVQGLSNTQGAYTLTLTLRDADPVLNEADRVLAYGRTVSGTVIGEAAREVWSFRGVQGDVIDALLHVTGGDLEPSLALLTPQGDTLLAANGTADAALRAVRLPATGIYTLAVQPGGTTQGTYDLALILRQPGEIGQSVTPEQITSGAAVRGRLTADAPSALYALSGGGVVALSVKASDPTQLITASVLTPGGALLGTYTGVNSVLASTAVPGTGEAWIEVSAVGLDTAHPLDFMLTAGWLTTAQRISHPLHYGQTYTATDSDGQAPAWHFAGQAGDLVTVDVVPLGPVLQGQLVLHAPDGTALVQRAVDAQTRQSLVLTADGWYEITFQPEATSGAYQIALGWDGMAYRSFDQRPAARLVDDLPTDLRAAASRTLPAGQSDSWQLDIPYAGWWRFDLEQTDNDGPMGLAIESPDGTTLATALTDTFTRQGTLQVNVPNAGRYHVVVFDPAGAHVHTYAVWGRPDEGGPLVPGEAAKGVLTADAPSDTWTIEALPDAQLSVHIDVPEGSSPPILQVSGPDGLLAASSQRSEHPEVVQLHTQTGGLYQISVVQPDLQTRLIYSLKATMDVPIDRLPATSLDVTQSLAQTLLAADATPAPTETRLVLRDLVAPAVFGAGISVQPESTEIEPASLVRGTIPPDRLYQAWTFSAAAGQLLGFTVTALEDGSGPALVLLDRTGAVLAETYQPGATSAYLTHRFAASGTYTVGVELQRGTHYTLWYDLLTAVDETVPVVLPGRALTYGDTTVGDLISAGDPLVYLFYGQTGDSVLVQTVRTDGEIPFLLTLEDAAGTILDQAEALDTDHALISDSVLPSDGIYQVRIQGGDTAQLSSAQIALHLDLTAAGPSTERGGGVLDQPVRGVLSAQAPTQRWLFTATAGDSITLRAEPPETLPAPFSLQLADSAGNVFAQREARFGQNTLEIADVIVPRSGVYQAIVAGGQRIEGAYRLTLETDTRPISDMGYALGYGETRGKTLTRSDFLDVWTFAGSAGDTVTVAVQPAWGDRVPLSFQLRDANGQVLGTTLAETESSSARLEHVMLPLSGHYSIVVGNTDQTFEGETAYQVSVLLEATSARSAGSVLRYGDTVRGAFYADDAQDTWLFEGLVGDMVTLTARGDTAGLEPALSLVATDWHAASANGQPSAVAAAQSVAGEPAEITVTLPTSGPYAVTVSAPGAVGGTYELQLTAAPTLSMPSHTLRAGQSRTGEIGSGVLAEAWTFDGTANDRVSVTVAPESRSQLAPTVRLVAPDASVLDSAQTLAGDDVQLSALTLPVTGRYTIVVGRALGTAGRTAGRYTVTLDQRTASAQATTITAYGRTERGALDSTSPVETWRFEGTQGDVAAIKVETTSGDLDAVLRLYDSAGELIAVMDDTQGLDPVLTAALSQNGTYTVEVERYHWQWGVTSGNYGLSIELVYRLGENTAAGNPIAYGSQVSGITDSTAPSAVWTFEGEASDAVEIALQFAADDSPLQLFLRDPDGNALAEGVRDRGKAAITGFVLPASGAYRIEVRRPADAQAVFSPYVLSVQLAGSAARPASPGGTLLMGSPAAGWFVTAPATHAWLFEGHAVQEVRFRLQVLEGTAALRGVVLAPDGSTVARFDDWPEQPVTLPLDGLYTLLVSGEAAALDTTYRVTLQSVPAEGTESSAQLLQEDGFGTLSDVQPQQVWQFEAEAGQTLCVRVEASTGTLEPTLAVWDPTGRLLTEGVTERTPQSAAAHVCGVLAPVTGTYELVVSRPGGAQGVQTGDYHVLLRAHAVSEAAALAQDVAFGQTVEGNLRDPQPVYYAFSARAGDIVDLAVLAAGDDPAPQLTLETESGDPMAVTVTTTRQENSISNFVVPAAGRYVAVVESSVPTTYRFGVFRRSAEAGAGGIVRVLAYDRTFVESVADPQQPVLWHFTGQAGDVLTFTVDTSGGGLRADLSLFGPGGELLDSAAEEPGARLITLGPLRLPDDGQYSLVVESWLGAFGGSTGRFTVQAQTAEPGVSGSTGGRIPVRGQAVYGGLTASDTQDVWTFAGEAGELIAVRTEQQPGPGQLAIVLRAPDGTLLGQSEAVESATTAMDLPAVLLPATGLYSITISGTLADETPIEYRLAVQQVQNPTAASVSTAQGIAYGTQTTDHFAPGEVRRAWVFYGQQGDRIRVVITPSDSAFVSSLYLIGPDGAVVQAGRGTASDSAVRLENALLPATGFYGLVVERGAHGSETGAALSVELDKLAAGARLQGVVDDTVHGTLTAGASVHEWLIAPGYTGDYLIEITAAGFTPRLYVVAGDGTLVRTGIPSGATAASIVALAGDTRYTAVVAGGPAVTSGSYTLRFVPASVVTNGGALDNGSVNVGHLDDAHFSDEWTVTGVTGNLLTATVERTAGDVRLSVSLFDENGQLLQRADSDSAGQVTLEFRLPSDGIYRLLVSRPGGAVDDTSGNYAITVRSS